MKISKEYLLLFNAITDAEEALSQLRESLMAAQRQAEELFMDEKEADPSWAVAFPSRQSAPNVLY